MKDKGEKIEHYKVLAENIKKNIQARKRPLIVEFSGLPKSGKTTVINSLSHWCPTINQINSIGYRYKSLKSCQQNS